MVALLSPSTPERVDKPPSLHLPLVFCIQTLSSPQSFPTLLLHPRMNSRSFNVLLLCSIRSRIFSLSVSLFSSLMGENRGSRCQKNADLRLARRRTEEWRMTLLRTSLHKFSRRSSCSTSDSHHLARTYLSPFLLSTQQQRSHVVSRDQLENVASLTFPHSSSGLTVIPPSLPFLFSLS